ncbi:MAG TPA: hypothetical protein VE379_04505 [Vicinamibacterales bacterium]|nr:hypothetical protein [Vicinamibacterales bacterium]
MNRPALAVGWLAALVLLNPAPGHAQQWIEMKSQNFVVTSNAGQGSTRTLVWQLEQVRHAFSALFHWARVDLDRPIAVFAVRDERSMRALAPMYWEQRGGMRPVSVWVTAPDRHYLAIRTDVQAEDKDDINPHMSAYYSYASLILQQSTARDLPEWFANGFAGVLSNTIVREGHILFGPLIPWHLERLREGARFRLSELLQVTRASRAYTNEESRLRFDAQSWAFVHFLIFGDKGTRRPKLDQFITLIGGGMDSEVAAREAFGDLQSLEGDFVRYVGRSLFTYVRADIEASVRRETFPLRPLTAAEAAGAMALFHAAMDQRAAATAAIADATKAAPPAADGYLAEALLLDRGGKRDEARAAYERAVLGGSTSGYAHYRLASLRWKPDMDRETMAGIEKLLLSAVAAIPRHAPSNAMLGEVRSLLGTGEGLPFARRAIALSPGRPGYRLVAARILMRQKKYEEALKEAELGLGLVQSEDDQREAKALVAAIEQARAR